jgi:hypothetical protein
MGTFYVRPAAVFARFVQAGKEKLSMRHRMALLETPALHAATIWENQRSFYLRRSELSSLLFSWCFYAMEMEEHVDELRCAAFRWWEFLLSSVLESKTT